MNPLHSRLAVVALNNAALAFLVKRQFCFALETLKDALKIVRQMMDPQVRGSEICATENILIALDRKNKRSAGLRQFSESKFSSPQVFSNQGNPQWAYEIIASSSNVSSVITIDPIDFEGSTDYKTDDMAYESAIILYNFGMVHICAANTVVKNSDSEELTMSQCLKYINAHRLFQFANSLLQKTTRSTVDLIVSSRVLFLSLLLTEKLTDMTIVLNLSSEHDAYVDAMHRLMKMTEIYKQLIPMSDSAIATAA